MHTQKLAALAVLTGLFFASSSFAAERAAAEKPKDSQSAGALYHVVSLKFKDSATREQVKAVEDAFRGLKGKIPGITSLRWGTNVSPEKLDKGYTHCFVLTFPGDKERDAYLVHPDHKAFGKLLGPVLDQVMVIDFRAQE